MTPAPHQERLPDAVLFDMDGTLVDSEHQWLRAEVAVMARYGVEWTHQDQVHCLGGPLERVGEYMARRAGVASGCTSEGVMLELLDEVEHLMAAEPLTWRPGARALLQDAVASKVPTALVTASWRRLINVMHSVIAVDIGVDPFTVMIGGDEVANGKPHPEPYLAAASALGAEPDRCLAVEDSPTGVSSAAAAGCRVVAVPHVAPIADAPGVVVVDTLQGRTVAALWAMHA